MDITQLMQLGPFWLAGATLAFIFTLWAQWYFLTEEPRPEFDAKYIRAAWLTLLPALTQGTIQTAVADPHAAWWNIAWQGFSAVGMWWLIVRFGQKKNAMQALVIGAGLFAALHVQPVWAASNECADLAWQIIQPAYSQLDAAPTQDQAEAFVQAANHRLKVLRKICKQGDAALETELLATGPANFAEYVSARGGAKWLAPRLLCIRMDLPRALYRIDKGEPAGLLATWPRTDPAAVLELELQEIGAARRRRAEMVGP